MYIQKRIEILQQMYALFDSFARTLDLACKAGCADCCTRNVTMTTMEAFLVRQYIEKNGMFHLLTGVSSLAGGKRFLPRMSINSMANRCVKGEPLLEEEPHDPSVGPCPLLSKDMCPVYPVRPFACRMMISSKKCEGLGFAEMDEFAVTASNVFSQYIEHIDMRGYTGNLIDILPLFDDAIDSQEYILQGAPKLDTETVLPNLPVPVLMIPPEHRERVQPLLKELDQLNARNTAE